MSRIKVVLADDHGLMRDAVRMVLDGDADFELAGEVANGRDLLPLVGRVQPDFVLLDVHLPGVDGLGCLEALANLHPNVKVAMLSGVEDRQVIDAAFRRGASAYILKSISPFDLPAAIRQIVEGSVIHCSPGSTGGEAPARAAGLSEKEASVLAELSQGHSNREIARRLWVSEQTVKFHLSNIYKKLGITSRTEALRYAYQHDLTTAPALAE
jgi:DNA-binding NarL/FixJ family response regulator